MELGKIRGGQSGFAAILKSYSAEHKWHLEYMSVEDVNSGLVFFDCFYVYKMYLEPAKHMQHSSNSCFNWSLSTFLISTSH